MLNLNKTSGVNKNSRNDRFYYLGFSYFNKIGPSTMQKLENYFPDLATAFAADSTNLAKAGLNYRLISEFINWRHSFSLEKVFEELEKEKINFLTWAEEDYPSLLKEIPSPPPILYYKGTLTSVNKNRLAVVGSRQNSAYSEKVINELLTPIVAAGVEIVSGLALGVDSLAHQVALDNKKITLAVLGSGLNPNHIYPRANRNLAENIIASGGAILSEFPPATPAYRQNFPQRNRIISGLASAVLIIEAKEKSGALITANFALEQNREILAVPGNIFSEFSAGPNNLIKAGAKTITDYRDILEIFKLTDGLVTKYHNHPSKNYDLNEIESLVYQLIKDSAAKAEKITTDEIIKKSQLDTATVNSTLSILEIKGIAKNDESGYDLN
jgi:DNA processing protein